MLVDGPNAGSAHPGYHHSYYPYNPYGGYNPYQAYNPYQQAYNQYGGHYH